MKHLFILNPVAGSKDRSNMISEAIAKLKIQGAETYVTVCAKDAIRHVHEVLARAKEHIRIYACGGDGTFNEVVTGVIKSGNKDCSVAPVPVGSGNDFIRSLPKYTPSDFRDIKRLSKGKVMPVDVMSVTDSVNGAQHFSINVASAGFDSDVADGMGKYRRTFGGKGSYKIALAECFLKYAKHAYKVICDGKDVFGGEKECMFALAANGCYYGGGFLAAPKAKPDDGLMDFMAIDRIGRLQFLKLVNVYKNGEHLEKAKELVTYIKCKSLKIIAQSRIPFNIDGEIVMINNPEIKIIPSAVNLVLPE